jgi:hypothetical protein
LLDIIAVWSKNIPATFEEGSIMKQYLIPTLFCLSITEPVFSKDVFMTGDEFKAFLASDKTIYLGGKGEGYAGTLLLSADGTGRGEVKTDAGDEIKLAGTWVIKKNTFCRTWKDIDKGKEVCETWKKIGENRVEVQVKKKKIGLNWW